jgi:hypothetical protein
MKEEEKRENIVVRTPCHNTLAAKVANPGRVGSHVGYIGCHGDVPFAAKW